LRKCLIVREYFNKLFFSDVTEIQPAKRLRIWLKEDLNNVIKFEVE